MWFVEETLGCEREMEEGEEALVLNKVIERSEVMGKGDKWRPGGG